MYFTISNILSTATLALPFATVMGLPTNQDKKLMARDCNLSVQWKSNWRDAGGHRYRVHITQSQEGEDLINHYCDDWLGHAGFVLVSNPQCGWNDEAQAYIADVTFSEGDIGHRNYLNTHNTAKDFFMKEKPECTVDMSI